VPGGKPWGHVFIFWVCTEPICDGIKKSLYLLYIRILKNFLWYVSLKTRSKTSFLSIPALTAAVQLGIFTTISFCNYNCK
jgi:hypothetical protein